MSKKTNHSEHKDKKASFLTRLFKSKKAQTKEAKSIFEEELVMSPTKLALNNFKSNRMAMVALILFLFIFLSSMLLPFVFPLDISYSNATTQNFPPTLAFLDVPKAMQHNPKDIAVGSGFSIGIDSTGNLHLWGYLPEKLRKLPKGLQKQKFKDVAAGSNHVVALDEKGKIWTWGNDEFMLDQIPPNAEYEQIKQVDAHHLYSIFETETGEFFKWGNEFTVSIDPDYLEGEPVKQLLTNSDTAIALTESKKLIPLTSQPFAIANIPEEIQGHVKTAALSRDHVYAVTDEGKIYEWGNPTDLFDVQMPEGLEGQIEKLYANNAVFIAQLKDGTLRAWGNSKQSELRAIPTDIPVEKVYMGFSNGYAIDKQGDVHGFGPKGFLMGTDDLGRDLFRRILLGGRMTMTVGAISIIISAIIGILIGGISGFYSGAVDVFLMRFAEVVSSIPFLPLAMILSSLIASKLTETQRIILIMVILGVLSWPGLARLTRAQILSERKREFVTAAQALGVKESKIIFKHIVPNVINVILVSITLGFATCMLTESSLSFLGFGVQPPQPTWGNMLNGSQSSVVIGTFWWRWVFPSLVLAISTISINSLGDGLRDAIDPKSNGR